jgi:hypothetical protein
LVNLVANDINASLVGRVQMNDQTLVLFDSLVLVYQIDDGGGFAGPGRAVQQQIGEILVFNHIHEKGLVVWIEHNVVKITGAILFGPGDIFVHFSNDGTNIYIILSKGNLRFPFEPSLKRTTHEGGFIKSIREGKVQKETVGFL